MDYEVKALPDGRSMDPGADAPKAVFGKSGKLLSPSRSLSALVFISEVHSSTAGQLKQGMVHTGPAHADWMLSDALPAQDHAKKENLSLHSPGPSAYSPKDDLTRRSSSRFTLASKPPSYFDSVARSSQTSSLGPAYQSTGMDSRGNNSWASSPSATFGRWGRRQLGAFCVDLLRILLGCRQQSADCLPPCHAYVQVKQKI